MKWFLISIAIACVIGLSFISTNDVSDKQKFPKELKGSYAPVALLELFTSEGCSSCPSADNLLPQLANAGQNVIPLSFHVDYWNRLGWTDPFSSNEYSKRQRNYARQFNLESVYTPQIIVNGEFEFVGSDRSKAEAIIQKVLKENALVKLVITELKTTGNKINFAVDAEGPLANTNFLAALVQQSVVMDVKAGENRGAKLHHTNVVRSFAMKPAGSKIFFELDIPENINDWQLIVYAQQKNDLKINGAVLFNPGH